MIDEMACEPQLQVLVYDDRLLLSLLLGVLLLQLTISIRASTGHLFTVGLSRTLHQIALTNKT